MINQSNEILSSFFIQVQKEPENLNPAERTKLALTSILIKSLKDKGQEFKLPAENTQEKIKSAGEQAFADNLEFMQLNNHLDVKKCSTDFKAFMTAYFYLSQQNQ